MNGVNDALEHIILPGKNGQFLTERSFAMSLGIGDELLGTGECSGLGGGIEDNEIHRDQRP